MLAFAAILSGLALGAASGGSVRRLERIHFRFEWLVILLFVVQGVARGRIAGTSASPLGLAVWVLSCLALLAVLAPDWRMPGVWIVVVGIALNLLVVLLNGGMPVLLQSGEVGPAAFTALSRSMGFYQLAGPGTLLVALGDVLLLRVGPVRLLASPGDLLLAVGVAVLIVHAMIAPAMPAPLGLADTGRSEAG